MAATLDVITLAEAKRALNIPDATTTHDTEIASYVTTVSQRLDSLVGPIVQRTITSEAHNGGRSLIALRKPPVASITAVVERRGTVAYTLTAENFAAPTSDDYTVDLDAGLLYRRSSGCASWWERGQRNVLVTYVAGRFADTASVDERYKQAAAIFLTHLWRKEQGASGQTFGDAPPDPRFAIPSFGVPNAVRDLLSDQLLTPAVA